MKILNLYAGIGGNRKLWPKEHEITAVEIKPEIAETYQKSFPEDQVIVGDAHQYLLEHYKEYGFIWSSPPCPTHSRVNYFLKAKRAVYPDMRLYEEIIFLENYFKGKWVVENVIPYYEPLIRPYVIGRHCFWSNFVLNRIDQPRDEIGKMCGKNQKAHDKTLEERNAINAELGLYILESAFNKKQTILEA